jgi:hypothetical protein
MKIAFIWLAIYIPVGASIAEQYYCGDTDVFANGAFTAATIPHTCTSLSLSQHSIGAEGATAIATALQGNSALTSLYLHGNNIGDGGATAIAAALQANTALTTLHLDSNMIGDAGATAIAAALQGNSALTTLHMIDNRIGDAGATAIAAALRGNSALTTLGMYANHIGDPGAAAIAAALQFNTALTTLDLGGNIQSNIQDSTLLATIDASLAGNKDPTKAAAKAASLKAAAALCGSHPRCEELVGAFIIEQFANLDVAKLLALGITSAVDLLVYAYEPTAVQTFAGDAASAAGANANEREAGYSYVTAAGGGSSQSDVTAAQQLQMQDTFAGLFVSLKPIPRRKLLKLLAEKALVVLPAIFGTPSYGLSVKEWASNAHVPTTALVALEAALAELGGGDAAADLEFLEPDDIKTVALKLMETSYLDAWWFEHAVVHIVTTLRTPTPTAQHTTDEL